MIDQLKRKDSPNDKIIYVLKGDPTYMAVMRFNGGAFMESTKAHRLKDHISVTSQYSTPCKDNNKPLGLVINFYFPLPIRDHSKKYGNNKNDYYTFKPDISNCIKYIECLLENIVYKDSVVISSVQAQKKFDEEPRTEFYFMEL